MKIDFGQVLPALDGNPLKDGHGEEVRLKDVCVTALTRGSTEEWFKVDPIEKYRRAKLAERIYESSEPVDLCIEEVAWLKELVGKQFNPIVVKRAWDVFEQKEDSGA